MLSVMLTWGLQTYKATMQSLTGYCIIFGCTLVAWKYKKQKVVSWSSSKVEYRSMAGTSCGITWLVSLHVPNLTLVPLYCEINMQDAVL